MKYARISPKDGHQRKKLRCPIRAATQKELAEFPPACPINHERFCSGKGYGCTTHNTPEDLRAGVPRQSKLFQETYAKRTEVERYFSRMSDREVEQTTNFNYRSIRNQMTIAHLTLALTAVVLQQPEKIRCFRSFADAA